MWENENELMNTLYLVPQDILDDGILSDGVVLEEGGLEAVLLGLRLRRRFVFQHRLVLIHGPWGYNQTRLFGKVGERSLIFERGLRRYISSL